MIESDLEGLAKELRKMVSLFCRATRAEEIMAYFDFLKDYSLATIGKAITRALEARDPADPFLKTVPLTALEIKQAADEVIAEAARLSKFKIGCDKCAGTGFILRPDQTGHSIARRCECWLEAMKARKAEEEKDGKRA